ncbi:hypothetical protein DXG03_003009 [Asterophora parasitica]|uniref:Uncharacterized protein n=1 Tax=Asterophora parasitica TaxID=117018 RepID=A0A9P7K7B9_9AGAR|nr:hypothetical protein DXG03_003009 [Asterophora parasitica]
MNPFGSFLLLQGLETLSLRAERHSANGLALATYLQKHPHAAWVSHIGLESHASEELVKQLLRPGFSGGMSSFSIKGDAEQAIKFVDSLQLVNNSANIGRLFSDECTSQAFNNFLMSSSSIAGDAKTLIVHPASVTHVHLGKEDQEAAGITPDLLRVLSPSFYATPNI